MPGSAVVVSVPALCITRILPVLRLFRLLSCRSKHMEEQLFNV